MLLTSRGAAKKWSLHGGRDQCAQDVQSGNAGRLLRAPPYVCLPPYVFANFMQEASIINLGTRRARCVCDMHALFLGCTLHPECPPCKLLHLAPLSLFYSYHAPSHPSTPPPKILTQSKSPEWHIFSSGIPAIISHLPIHPLPHTHLTAAHVYVYTHLKAVRANTLNL